VIAVSLRHNLLDRQKTLKVLETAKKHLLTPYGLRTLAPSDSRYRPRYQGDVWSRDSAYHQGTVWPWLAGPYFSSLLRYSEDADVAISEAQSWIDRFSEHLQEACLGQVSEIFDGDEPHNPGGCIAQAWSVAELLRLAKLVDRKASESKNARGREDRQLAGAARF
jgi:glycogen debranching enzyme